MVKSPFKICIRITTISAFAMLISSMLYLLAIWDTIPDNIGVHFSSEGQFDVYDSKSFSFYPYIVGLSLLIIIQFLEWLSKKATVNNKYDETKVRLVFIAFCNVIKICVSVFFTYWADCVIKQHELSTTTAKVIFYIILVSIIISVITANRMKHK